MDLPAEIRVLIYESLMADLDAAGIWSLSGYSNFDNAIEYKTDNKCIIDDTWPNGSTHI